MTTTIPKDTAYFSLDSTGEIFSVEKYLCNLLKDDERVDEAYLRVYGNAATSDEIDLIILSPHSIDELVNLIDIAASEGVFFSLTILDTDDPEASKIVSGYSRLTLA